jgi:hypothetical protein
MVSPELRVVLFPPGTGLDARRSYVNPYQSPRAALGAPSRSPEQTEIHWSWLVFLSLLAAILIEVLPTEATVLYSLRTKGTLLLVAGKIGCVAAILLPLVLYVLRNGWRGIMPVKGRIAAIVVILLAKCVFDVAWFFLVTG